MITQARISGDLKPAGLDWITALRAPAIKALLDSGALQMSLFDDRDMAGITSPEFPGERLIVCRNRALAGERARKRGSARRRWAALMSVPKFARLAAGERWIRTSGSGREGYGLAFVFCVMGLLFGAQLLGFEGAKQPDSLAGPPRVLVELNADPVAVAPRGIEQN